MRAALIGSLLLAALALAPAALAAPPTFVSVTANAGKTAATWSLPTGGQVWTVEIASAPAVDSDGYFLLANVLDTEVFIDGTTSWTSDTVLDPGTYYIHASGWDKNCSTCQVPEWSAIRTFTVGAASSGSGSSGGSSGSTTGSSGGSTSSSGGSTGASGGSSSPSTTDTTGSDSTTSGSQPDSSAVPAATPELAAFGTVTSVTAKLKGSLASVAFRVCGSGNVSVKVAVTRGTRSHGSLVTLPVGDGGCTVYELRLSVPSGSGKASVSVGGVVKPL